jgi:Heavy metal binding domain
MKWSSLLIAIALGASSLAGQQAAKPSTEPLPPLSYVCPMAGDEDVIEDKPGVCRKCGMELKPIRLDSVWTCATRPLLIVEAKPGKCPVDGTPLVQVTAAVSWTCKDNPAIDVLQPGTCADGQPMIKRYAARAHGNHNPQHGGQFFMAPDNWHHVEGAYLSNGIFRLYLYDDFTKPLPLPQARDVTARIVTKQTFDPATRTTKELAAAPLVRRGRLLEARIGKLPLPAQMTAKVSFKRGGPEHVFDFAFDKFSKEPVAAPTLTDAAPTAMPPPTTAESPESRRSSPAKASEGGPPATESATLEVASGVDPALVPVPIPETLPEILAQLRTRTDQIRAFIDRGSFASVYVPAFQAKDLALALDTRKDALSPEKRKAVVPAIAQLVRSAYLLDAFGDLGNKQQIVDAFAMFSAAANEIETSFAGK